MAALTLGELVWKITGDNSGLKSSLNDTDKAIGKTGQKASTFGKIFKSALFVAAVAAVKKIGSAMIGAASDAEETSNKFGVVFSGVIDDANRLASTLSTSYGLARTESKALLSSTGDLLTGFGVSQKEALKLSYQVQTLAVDLASFTNYAGGAEGASHALTSALLGETEQAKSLGLALGETQLRDFAESQGKVFKNLSQNEKMFLRLELAVSQSKNAIGDFNRSINSYANQMRIAEANTQNLTETYGKALLPIATLVVKAFNDSAQAAQDNADAFVDFVKSAEGARKIGNVIGTIVASLRVMQGLLDPIIDSLKFFAKEIYDAIGDIEGLIGVTDDANIILSLLSTTAIATATAFKIFAVAIAGAIRIVASLIGAIIESGKVIGSFYQALSGGGSWDEFYKQVQRAGESYKTFGTTAVNSTNKLFGTITDSVNNFAGDQAKLTSNIAKTFKDSQKGVSDTVQSVLTAEQELVAANKENTESNKQKKAQLSALGKEYKKIIADQSEFARLFGVGSQEAYIGFAKMSKSVQDFATVFNSVVGQIQGLMSAINDYQQAVYDNQVERLDAQMQKELEAAGVAEATAVQQAEQELARAEREGTEEEKRLAKNALKKAKIEEKYAKKKAETEYQAALAAWELQRAMAAIQLVAAPLNAFVSTLAAPWPLNMILAPINAALAAATAGIQYAAIVKAKPEPPAFATGGIVPGSSFTGDNVTASVNSGEMILNKDQQAELFNVANGGSAGTQGLYRVIADENVLWSDIYAASKNGQLYIAERAVTRK